MGIQTKPEPYCPICGARMVLRTNRKTGGRVCGNIWPSTFLPCDLGLSFTQDLMPLLSVEVYEEFGIPCLERLGAEFGGLHLHCCGDWGRHAPALARCGTVERGHRAPPGS